MTTTVNDKYFTLDNFRSTSQVKSLVISNKSNVREKIKEISKKAKYIFHKNNET